MSRFRTWLEARPGVPVVLVGFGYIVLGLLYIWGLDRPFPIDWFLFSLYELLSFAVVYGGLRLINQRRSLEEGVHVFVATVGFGFIGFLVASALSAFQFRRGVQLEAVWFLLTASSATTAAIGVGLALYYIDLRAERARYSEHAATVSELNKRLTVLHRVLRHNLRNELTIFHGHAQMLLDRNPSPEVADSLRTLVAHAKNMESLSENAYHLRRVWAEETRVELELAELVEDCVRECEAAHPEVTITRDLPAHAVVRAHPRLDLAVEEAIDNAIVHNDSPTVDVSVDVNRIGDEESTVAISISDTGTGIPEFEPEVLEQVEETPLEHTSGLGLWLIYWIVEQSGGSLRFEANEPRGTIVRMQLPAVAD